MLSQYKTPYESRAFFLHNAMVYAGQRESPCAMRQSRSEMRVQALRVAAPVPALGCNLHMQELPTAVFERKSQTEADRSAQRKRADPVFPTTFFARRQAGSVRCLPQSAGVEMAQEQSIAAAEGAAGLDPLVGGFLRG